MSSISARFAPELIDTIIDYLHNDAAAIQACSRVCRAWRPASRFHLLERACIAPRSLPKVLQLLDPPLSTIASCVRVLEINGRNENRWECQPPCWLDCVIELLPAFTAVESLTLRNLSWLGIGGRAQAALLANFQTVRELTLWNVDFIAFEHICAILCAFPFVNKLIFHCDTSHLIDIPLPTPLHPLSRLRTLSLSEVYSNRIVLEWMCNLHISSVEDLTLRNAPRVDTLSIGRYLRTLGPSLKRLELFPLTRSFYAGGFGACPSPD